VSGKKRAIQALSDCVSVPLDEDLRAEDLGAIVVRTVRADARAVALGDIERGDGSELLERKRNDGSFQQPKLHSVYSSCGLAVNTFGPWRLEPGSLVIGVHRNFTKLTFEEHLRIFRGGRAPNLDLVLTAPGRVLAIESKLTEHLGAKRGAEFSTAYDRLEGSTHPTWWAAYRELVEQPNQYTHLDAAQLIKHYFGLNAYRRKADLAEATLLYLYWEPEDAADWPELRAHRDEVERFARTVGDPQVRFESMTYPDLWSAWSRLSTPPWLGEHVAALEERYRVRLGT
jgi:hypothetical protein